MNTTATRDPNLIRLRELLGRAGFSVPLEVIARWSATERAAVWAYADDADPRRLRRPVVLSMYRQTTPEPTHRLHVSSPEEASAVLSAMEAGNPPESVAFGQATHPGDEPAPLAPQGPVPGPLASPDPTPATTAPPPRTVADRAATLATERTPYLGAPAFGHTSLGRTWAALLRDHLQVEVPALPGHVVALMMVALKLHRAVRPFPIREDDYVDGHVYLDFAHEFATVEKQP